YLLNRPTRISSGPADESGHLLHFIVSNDNIFFFSSHPAHRPLHSFPTRRSSDLSGSATVTVTLHDDGGTANGGVDTSAPQTFVITGSAHIYPPVIVLLTNSITVWEDAGPQSFANFATNILAGPPNEAGQTLNFLV